MSLRDCLEKYGRHLETEDRNRLRDIAQDLHAKGMDEEKASQKAVRRLLDEAEDDAADIRRQLKSQGVTAEPVAISSKETEAVQGAPSNTMADRERIAVDPLPGGNNGKKTKDILLDLQKAIGKPVRIGSPKTKGAGGAYYPGTSKTLVKYHNDIDTTAHELAHALDDEYGIVGEWAGKKASPFDAELEQFWQHGSTPPDGISKESRITYQRAEGVAEYMRAALLNPKEAIRAAPLFAKFIKEKLPESVRGALNTFSGDVRKWAGQDSLGRTKANIRNIGDTGDAKGITATLREELRKEHGDLFNYGFADRAKETIQDVTWAMVKGIRLAKRESGRDILPENDPEVLMRLAGGGNDILENIMDHGPTDIDGKPYTGIKGGADSLLDWADTTSAKTIEDDILTAAAVGISERVGDIKTNLTKKALEKAQEGTKGGAIKIIDDLNERLSRLTGVGGGMLHDIKEARRALENFNAMPEEKKARIQEGIKRLRAWSRAGLQHLVDTGILSKERFDKIVEDNPHYIDMHRVMEDEKLGAVLKEFRGSTRQIENPFISAIAMTDAIYRQGARNMALRKFRDLLIGDRKMYDGKPSSLDSIGRLMPDGDENGTKIMVDGKAERWEFNPDIQRALESWGEIPVGGRLDKALLFSKKVLQYAVVHSIPFMVRNIQRDALNRGVISNNGSKPWDIFSKIDKEDYRHYRRIGGGQAGHYMRDKVSYHKEMAKRIKQLSGEANTIVAVPGRGVRAWESLSQKSELVGRMAEYRAAYKKGLEKGYNERNARIYAASEARGLMDYAVAGDIARNMVFRYVPFFNPAIQGLHRSYTSAKTNPLAFAKRWALYVGTTSMLSKVMQAAFHSEEDQKEYYQLPAWRKDSFWNVKIGGMWLSVPKPFELGTMAVPFERFADHLMGDDRAFDGMGGSMAKSMIPIDDGALVGPLRPIVESITNHSFFKNKGIVHSGEEKLDLDLRKGTKYASSVGQALQELIGADSRMIDNFIRGSLGTLGTQALAAGDVVAGNKNASTDRLLQSFIGMTASMPLYDARDVEYVLKKAESRGETGRANIVGLKRLLKGAMDAPEDQKENRARQVYKTAAGIRRMYEQREK